MVEILGSYDGRMVAFSYVIAAIASLTSLSLAKQVSITVGRARWIWFVSGALAMGLGFWVLQLIALLAMDLTLRPELSFRLAYTSSFIAILTSSIVIYTFSRKRMNTLALFSCGCLLGIGSSGMHALAISSLNHAIQVHYDYSLFAFGCTISVSLCMASLKLAYRYRNRESRLRRMGTGLLLGGALTASHYLAMASITLTANRSDLINEGHLADSFQLAVILGIATILILGIAVICALLERFWVVQMRQQLERDKRIESLFQHSQDAVFSFSLDGHLLDSNHAAQRITGFSRDDLINKPATAFICPEFHHTVRVHFEGAINGHSRNFDSALTHRDGRRIEINNTSVPVVVEDQVVGVYMIVRDITERKASEQQMNYLAHHDQLTGLPNRRLFEQQLSKIIAGNSIDHHPVALLFLDIDRFKLVNDSQGHDIGDLLLRSVADRLRDAVQDSGIVARLGGDEFSVLLSEGTTRAEARDIAHRINREIDIPFYLRGKDIHITTSIGIVLYPEDGDSLISLMKNADTAMYSAKENGKNTYQFYTQNMNATLIERVQLENELRKALDRSEFFLVYQPQVDIASGKIVGVEALIRWQHGKKGLISPADFIPLAEETGMIVPIGDWVLESACKQAKRWSQAGIPPLRMSVNLSSRQFMSENFAENVQRIVQQTLVEPGWLDLEITESMTLDVNRSIATLHQLKQLGVTISIDDFGTGYSSLSYLKSFPVDRLKIDQSFIRQMLSDTNDRSIVSTIISLAHNLNLQVVAEGVETVAQSVFLASHGCDEMQGYFISKPLPEEEIQQFILQQSSKVSKHLD